MHSDIPWELLGSQGQEGSTEGHLEWEKFHGQGAGYMGSSVCENLAGLKNCNSFIRKWFLILPPADQGSDDLGEVPQVAEPWQDGACAQELRKDISLDIAGPSLV
jgi:hypothetical protein